jgi:hypothetical protein
MSTTANHAPGANNDELNRLEADNRQQADEIAALKAQLKHAEQKLKTEQADPHSSLDGSIATRRRGFAIRDNERRQGTARHCETAIIRIKQPPMTVGVYCNVIASLRSNPENQHITKTRHWQEERRSNLSYNDIQQIASLRSQ